MVKSFRKSKFGISILSKPSGYVPAILLAALLIYAGKSFYEIHTGLSQSQTQVNQPQITSSSSQSPTPTTQTESEYSKLLDAKRHIWGTPGILGTSATAIGGFVVYLNFLVGNANRQIAKEKQVTERFTKAVELLGTGADKKQIQVRIGAIYALEQIALDYPSEYLRIVVNILSAFVRETSWPSKTEVSASEEESPKRTPTDIQAALDVVSKIIEVASAAEKQNNLNEIQVDFSRSYLKFAWLNHRNLEKAYLWYTDLSKAYLEKAELPEADLWGAKLVKADLREAVLHKAKMGKVDLTGADLRETDLTNANLRYASLTDANLKGAILTGAVLFQADLSGCRNLKREQISGLKRAFLCGTILPDHLNDIDPNRDLENPEFLKAFKDTTGSLKKREEDENMSKTREYIRELLVKSEQS